MATYTGGPILKSVEKIAIPNITATTDPWLLVLVLASEYAEVYIQKCRAAAAPGSTNAAIKVVTLNSSEDLAVLSVADQVMEGIVDGSSVNPIVLGPKQFISIGTTSGESLGGYFYAVVKKYHKP